MFWSASRLMSKPVRLLARRTDSYVHAHTVLRSPMRLFGAVAGASASPLRANCRNWPTMPSISSMLRAMLAAAEVVA